MSGLSEPGFMDDIAVTQLHSGDGTAANIIFKFNDNRICVSIFPSNGTSTKDTRHLGTAERPLRDHLIDTISQATKCQDYDQHENLVEEVLIVILDAGRPLFSGQPTPTQDDASLERFLFPPTLQFRLEAPAGSASIVPIDPSESNLILTIDPSLDQNFHEELEILNDLPRFTPAEITVTESFVRGSSSIAAAVRMQGRDMFCKARGGPNGLYGTGEGRELECLGQMPKAFPQPSMVQVPPIIGYIHHKDTKQVLGFLREWVPGRRLSDIDITAATLENREKWRSQISDTIERLHEHGLVWGDGKPSNIVIDENNDAWLIDFGGGYTDGWVDQELADTVDGDKQALRKILEFIGQGETK